MNESWIWGSTKSSSKGREKPAGLVLVAQILMIRPVLSLIRESFLVAGVQRRIVFPREKRGVLWSLIVDYYRLIYFHYPAKKNMSSGSFSSSVLACLLVFSGGGLVGWMGLCCARVILVPSIHDPVTDKDINLRPR